MSRLARILSPLIVAGASAPAWACAVCSTSSSENPRLAESANLSVLVMIGFVAAVLTGIASVAGFWYVRSRRIPPQID